MNRYSWPRSCKLISVSAWLRLDTSLKSNQLRPSGARKFRREERLHGKCGDWRTLLSYPVSGPERKRKTCLCLGCAASGKWVWLIFAVLPQSTAYVFGNGQCDGLADRSLRNIAQLDPPAAESASSRHLEHSLQRHPGRAARHVRRPEADSSTAAHNVILADRPSLVVSTFPRPTASPPTHRPSPAHSPSRETGSRRCGHHRSWPRARECRRRQDSQFAHECRPQVVRPNCEGVRSGQGVRENT